MKVRWTPQSLGFPALKGKLIVDTYRGQMRVRSWPRKTGPSKSAQVRRQNQWFKQANALARKAVPSQMALAIDMTKGTGLYPRDLLLRQMSGGIYDIITGEGVNYQPRSYFRESKVFQGVVLELDAPMTFAAGVRVFPIWPLPILDTLGFWDVGDPSWITIPAGINVVELFTGFMLTPSGQGFDLAIWNQVPKVMGETFNSGLTLSGGVALTGPIPVVEGNQFRIAAISDQTRDTDPTRRNFFSLNVLEAD